MSVIGKYFIVRERFRVEKTPWVIKITDLGDSIPQRIEGILFNTETGQVTNTQNGRTVFACELDKIEYPQGIPIEALEVMKQNVIDKINSF